MILRVDHHLRHRPVKITRLVEQDVEARKTVLGGEVKKVLLVHEDPSRLHAPKLWVVYLDAAGDHRGKKIAIVVLVMSVD